MSPRLSLLWGALLCPAFASLPAAALDVQERSYQYTADSVFFRAERTFLLGDFQPVRLPPPPSPVPLALAARESRPAPPLVLPFEPNGQVGASEPLLTRATGPVSDIPSACALAEIHFTLGSAAVSKVAARELLGAVGTFATRRTPLEVRGYTCDLGGQKLNDKLAVNRAEAVARVLRKAGYRVVIVTGRGRVDYCTRDSAVRPVNRRVEVRPARPGATQGKNP